MRSLFPAQCFGAGLCARLCPSHPAASGPRSVLDQQHTGTSQTPADSTWPSRLTAQPHVLTCSARLSQEGARAKRAPRVAPPCLRPWPPVPAQDWLQSLLGAENIMEGRASRGVPGRERVPRLAAGMPLQCTAFTKPARNLGPRAPRGAMSMPLTQLQGFSTSWHPQFQLSKHLPFTLAVPLQSQQAKCQEKRTCIQDAAVALLTPSPTPTTQILGHLCTGAWFCSAEDTPLARADQAPPCSSSAGTRGEESPISWTNRATAQLSGTPKTQRSGEG